MMEDKIESEDRGRDIIVPTAEDQKNTTNGPVLIRDYQTLEPVDMNRVKNALEQKDDQHMVMAPIGGRVSLTMKDCFMDDVVIVPPAFVGGKAQVMHACQLPVMFDQKPPMEHDIGYEIDCGRFPNVGDMHESAAGQQKPEEQVLAIPAEDFLRTILDQSNGGEVGDLTELVFNNLSFLRRAWCEDDLRFIQLLPYIFFWRNNAAGEIEIFVYQRGKESGEGRLAMGCSIGVGGHINPVDFLSTQLFAEVSATTEEMEIHHRRGPRLLCEGFWAGIVNSLLREVDEEIEIKVDGKTASLLSIIEDTIVNETAVNSVPATQEEWIAQRTTFFLDLASNPVEKAHLGVFIGIQLPSAAEVTTREEILVDVGFKPLNTLYGDQFASVLPTPLECWSRSIVDSIYETIDFFDELKKNVTVTDVEAGRTNSKYVFDGNMAKGIHNVSPEVVAMIPKEDRWKVGTLAGSMSWRYRMYAMNAFVRA